MAQCPMMEGMDDMKGMKGMKGMNKRSGDAAKKQ
jgi:hypothetical protein